MSERPDDRRAGEPELPPRPRGRLLRPLPLALIAATIAAAGFLGGVLTQKGSEDGAALVGPRGAGLPSFAGRSSAAARGSVTSVEGHTIYVKESDGTVVAVKVGAGATVTRDSNVSARKVHPGDTVVIEGSKHGSTVRASAVTATESGVESTAAFGAEAEPSVESLFGE